MSTVAFTKVFSPRRFGIGAGMVVVGLLFFFLLRQPGRGKLKALLAGLFGVGGGIALIATSREEACGTCKKILDSTSTAFPESLDGQVRAAVAALGHGDVMPLLTLESAPVDAFRAPVAAYFTLEHCPQCVQVARVSATTATRTGQGTTGESNRSAKVDVAGPHVKRIIELMTRRNEAANKLAMSGA